MLQTTKIDASSMVWGVEDKTLVLRAVWAWATNEMSAHNLSGLNFRKFRQKSKVAS
jgi:hypothetical protein